MTIFLKKGNHPPGHRADGPPGRWKKKNIRNKKKQREITDGREQTAGQGAGRKQKVESREQSR